MPPRVDNLTHNKKSPHKVIIFNPQYRLKCQEPDWSLALAGLWHINNHTHPTVSSMPPKVDTLTPNKKSPHKVIILPPLSSEMSRARLVGPWQLLWSTATVWVLQLKNCCLVRNFYGYHVLTSGFHCNTASPVLWFKYIYILSKQSYKGNINQAWIEYATNVNFVLQKWVL